MEAARAQSYHFYGHYDDAAAPASSSPDSSSGGSFDSGFDQAWARDIATMKAMKARANTRRFDTAPATAQLERDAGAGLARAGTGGVLQPRGEPAKVRARFPCGRGATACRGCNLSRILLRPAVRRCAALDLASPRRCARLSARSSACACCSCVCAER